MGVFLWGTDSAENQRVPQGEPVLGALPVMSAVPSVSINTGHNQTLFAVS